MIKCKKILQRTIHCRKNAIAICQAMHAATQHNIYLYHIFYYLFTLKYTKNNLIVLSTNET